MAETTKTDREIIEGKLIDMIREYHNIPDSKPITPETSLSDLGLDSLDAVEVQMKADDLFNANLYDLENEAEKTGIDIHNYYTIERITDYIMKGKYSLDIELENIL